MATAPSGEFATSDKVNGSGFTNGLVRNPDKVLMSKGGDLEVYREVLRDDQVASTFQQRRRAVVSSEWEVEPASESAQDKDVALFVKEQLKRIKFDALTDKMLYAVYYGYTVAEILWGREEGRIIIDQIKVKNQAKYRWNEEGDLMLMTRTKPQGEQVPDRKFWTVTTGAENDENPYGLGLGHFVYWPVYFKKNGLKFWAIFLEKFGMPTAAAKMTAAAIDDPRMRQKALQALQAIQSDSGILIPEGVEIELMEAARSGTADYQSLQETMNKAISKIILSQTMTTDDGSSRSQSETHKDVRDEVVKADADLICESFTDQVIRWLVDFNYGEEVPAPRVWRKTEPEEDALERVERDKGISELGFEPTEDYIRENYGEGWVKKQAPAPLGTPLDQLDPGAPSFSEAGMLEAARRSNAADQQAIAVAASQMANKYEEVIGDRIQQLIELTEETGDFETFRERLNSLLEEGPTDQQVEKVTNAGFFARLMGRIARQR